MTEEQQAPGAPGAQPHWTTSRKSGVGAARGLASHVWFTIEHGILSEVFYPRVDRAALRDLGLVVTGEDGFFSEEKADADSVCSWLEEGVPGFRLTNTCRQGRYVIEKEIVADPRRSVVLQRTRFIAKQGDVGDYHVHALLAPHLGNSGWGNRARVGEFKGVPMLFAEREGFALALACSVPWRTRSAGFVGASDGFQDLKAHGRLTWHYATAESGNVALVGEIDLSNENEFVLALGFGQHANEAAQRARISLNVGFEAARTEYERAWVAWQEGLRSLECGTKGRRSAYRVSMAVLGTHESKAFPGGTIASLSFPWGEAQGDDDRGGYHLVWPRDMYETVSALLAAGANEEAVRALRFLEATQEDDGHWPQNMWLDGTCYWPGIQLDETAAPVLLLDLALRHGAISRSEVARLWPMIRRAASFLVLHGPSSPQDRWEEDAGLTAFTLASVIAALLVAADMADAASEAETATYLRETADCWHEAIERWTYVEQTPLAKKTGVSGYYVRVAPPARLLEAGPFGGEQLRIANRKPHESVFPAAAIVSVDALALVRFGLRAAHDPRIKNTVRVIDSVLKVDTPHGPAWHRYNEDGYGEHADGSAFDGVGIGRAWPLLVGERAHYELLAGNRVEAERLLGVMEALAGETGFLSEQVWDTDSLPEKNLYRGRPSGSAQPLVWAHAEHVKLLRSLKDGQVFDLPPQTVERYVQHETRAARVQWRFEAQLRQLPARHVLRVETRARTRVRWSADGWQSAHDADSTDSRLGLFVVDLPTAALAPGERLEITFFWPDAQRWEGVNFAVTVVA